MVVMSIQDVCNERVCFFDIVRRDIRFEVNIEV